MFWNSFTTYINYYLLGEHALYLLIYVISIHYEYTIRYTRIAYINTPSHFDLYIDVSSLY